MCVDLFIDMCVCGHAYRHVHRLLCRHVCTHVHGECVYRHMCIAISAYMRTGHTSDIVMAYLFVAYIFMGYRVMAGTGPTTCHGCSVAFLGHTLYRLYIGIAEGMSIARVWAYRYLK